jgi:hypothetical protein
MWHRLNSRLFGDVGSWVRFFLTIILNPRELRKAITFQQSTDDQAVWLTTAQAGFPLTRDEEELINSKDAQMGRPTARHLHPAISEFIAFIQAELTSTGQLPSPLEQAAIDFEEESSQKHITGLREIPTDPPPPPLLTPAWELDPPPLMANHPPRITDSNIRITLREGSLRRFNHPGPSQPGMDNNKRYLECP